MAYNPDSAYDGSQDEGPPREELDDRELREEESSDETRRIRETLAHS